MSIILDANEDGTTEVHGRTPSDYDVTVSYTPVVTITGGTTDDEEIDDGTWRHYTGADVLTEAQVTVDGVGIHSTEFFNLRPLINNLDQNGLATRIINGTGHVAVQTNKGGGRTSFPLSFTNSNDSSAFLGYNDGTLAKAMNDAMTSYITGGTSLNPPYPGKLTLNGVSWNENCWLRVHNINFYPLVYANTQTSFQGGGIACHPSFVLCADHYPLYQVGKIVKFRTSTFQLVERAIVSYTRVGTTDLGVTELSSPLPESIGYCRVMPSDWHDYFPHIFQTGDAINPNDDIQKIGVQGFWKDQELNTVVSGWAHVTYSGGTYRAGCQTTCSVDDPAYPSYFGRGQSGDSSNAYCLIHPVHKYLIPIYTLTSTFGLPGNVTTSGSAILKYATEINAIMHSKIPGSVLVEADLTDYPSFP
jgi:hypothetical protein